MVAGKFALGLRAARGAEAALVASRSATRAATFARQLGVARWVEGYEAAAADPGIDAVYIATPPSEHRANTLLFIEAGKPVLVEKPFTPSAADAEAVFAAAKARGVFCMEGLWTRFLPAMTAARRVLSLGAIGEPVHLAASFSVANVVVDAHSLFRPELGGGGLLHRGVYPIALALDLLGPASLISAELSYGSTGVDEAATITLRHAQGATSSLYAGLRATTENGLTVIGTQGELRLRGPIYRPFGLEIRPVRPRRQRGARWDRMDVLKESRLAQGLRQRLDGLLSWPGAGRRTMTPYLGNGYAHEALAVAEALEAGWIEHPTSCWAATLDTLRLMDAVRGKGPVP